SLLIDGCKLASGSHNAFEAIFDCISADKLKPFQIRNVFSTLRSSEGTLNITRILLLDYVLHVNLEGNVAGEEVWLNFAHYLKEFCIHKTHNYIPIKELFNEDCALVTGRFIENLRDVIYKETLTWERTFAVKVVEVLQIDTSFNILTPLFNETNKTPNELKAMALRALKNSHPDRDMTQSLLRKPAMDLLKEVYSDFNQDFQVRAAALLSFISWQPNGRRLSASKLANLHHINYDAKLILGVNEKIPPSFENFVFEILTKKNDLSLLKFENYAMFSKASERPYSVTPHDEFFTKFMMQRMKESTMEEASAIYTRGVGVYLPWSLKSHNSMIRSNIELNIPVGIMEERHYEIEGMVRTFKIHFNIGFEKKFPALRLSKTPMTITFHFDPVNHSPVTNFVTIKKFDIEEKVISEIHPFTGMKYDLIIRADTRYRLYVLRKTNDLKL
ncbi:hypothetical protein Avbf_15068, partial [Armadillidium vulgare]